MMLSLQFNVPTLRLTKKDRTHKFKHPNTHPNTHDTHTHAQILSFTHRHKLTYSLGRINRY